MTRSVNEKEPKIIGDGIDERGLDLTPKTDSKSVTVKVLDESPRYFQDKWHLLVTVANRGYLVPSDKVVNGKVLSEDLERAFELYGFEVEIKATMPTESEIREALWLRGAYDKSFLNRDNVRGLFPAVLKKVN